MFSYRARSVSPFGYRAGSEVANVTAERSTRATSLERTARETRATSATPILSSDDVLRPYYRSYYYIKTDPSSLYYSPTPYSQSYLDHYYGSRSSYYYSPRYTSDKSDRYSSVDSYNPYLNPFYTRYSSRYSPVLDVYYNRYPYLSSISPYYSSYRPLTSRFPVSYSRVY